MNEHELQICSTCTGAGIVTVREEGEMFSTYCKSCGGEGVIEGDEPLSELLHQTNNEPLSVEERKAIRIYGKQIATNFVGDKLSQTIKELMIGLALQAFEDGLIYNKKNPKK
jgi:hypothetical protein